MPSEQLTCEDIGDGHKQAERGRVRVGVCALIIINKNINE